MIRAGPSEERLSKILGNLSPYSSRMTSCNRLIASKFPMTDKDIERSVQFTRQPAASWDADGGRRGFHNIEVPMASLTFA